MRGREVREEKQLLTTKGSPKRVRGSGGVVHNSSRPFQRTSAKVRASLKPAWATTPRSWSVSLFIGCCLPTVTTFGVVHSMLLKPKATAASSQISQA